jgi:hypothetical protein
MALKVGFDASFDNMYRTGREYGRRLGKLTYESLYGE